MTVISLLGPPGSGKTTQAQNIAREKNLLWVSPGHIFRSINLKDTKIDLKVQEYTQKGISVPSELTYQVLNYWLENQNMQNGYVFDSHPRNYDDNGFFFNFMSAQNLRLDYVIYLRLDKNVAVSRLLKRAYLEDRGDENQAAVERRFDVFSKETMPLIETLSQEYPVYEVDADNSPDTVWESIQKIMTEHTINE